MRTWRRASIGIPPHPYNNVWERRLAWAGGAYGEATVSDPVLVTNQEGVRVVRMNRPEKKNALTQPMYAAMTAALRQAQASTAIRCIMIAGGPGSAFCAGSDIGEFQQRAEGGLESITIDFLHALARNQKPLVAAVGGL